MPVDEKLMAAGSFTVPLLPDTPPSVVDGLEWFGLIAITATHIDAHAMSTAGLLGVALYAGVYMEHADRKKTLSGQGLAALLGSSGGLGNTFVTDQTIEDDLEDAIEAFVLRESAGNPVANGITQGAISTTITTDAAVSAGASPLDALNAIIVSASLLSFWRINPDLTLDADLAANLFQQGQVILNPWWGGRDANITGYRTSITYRADVHDTATTVSVREDDNTLVSDDGTFTYYDLQGDVVVRRVYISGDVPDGSGAARAALEIARRETAHSETSASVEGYAVRSEIEPGDNVYLYDPEMGWFTSEASILLGVPNEVYYRGQVMQPGEIRVQGIRWPIQQGMGVYYIALTDDTADQTITDLTRYVAWEDGPTELELGALRRVLRAKAA